MNRSTRLSRREAFRFGGASISLAALVAACGADRGGSADPGRVGALTDDAANPLPDYAVDDNVLLRTATSLEFTAVEVYRRVAAAAGASDLLSRLSADHAATATSLQELTASEGGDPWTGANPWYVDRTIEPAFAVIDASDDPARDGIDFAIAFENVLAAAHQTLAGRLGSGTARVAEASRSAASARHAVALVSATRGSEAFVSPGVTGQDVAPEGGRYPQYAITSRFGSLAQIELLLGAADENDNRTAFSLATPADNSYIYTEYGAQA